MADYKAAIVTVPGFEDIAAAEVNELIGAKATAEEAGVIAFQVKQPADICKLCYLSQSATSVFFQGVKTSPFDLGSREYSVFGKQDDVNGILAYLLLRASGYSGREFLFDPFTRSGVIAIEAAIFSSGFPVSHYRKDALSSFFSRLQPFSKVGFNEFFSEVEEESESATLKKNRGVKPRILASSPSMQFVRSAEKNAKVGGVNKLIRFSRLDIEWLDAKLDERSVDLVVSYPPQFKSGGSSDFAAAENKKLAVLYRNFFYQADFFLKQKGRIVLLLKKGGWAEVASAALAYKFKAEITRSFSLGSAEFELVNFSRNL